MNDAELLPGLLTALGVGLMIGVVRERRHQPDVTKAGTRTHALVAILGYVSWGFGTWPFGATVLVVGALVTRGYQATARSEPGQTGEIALLVTLMLSAMAHQNPAQAAGLGVLVAVLLYAKQASQRISRVLITEQGLQDALMLAAAALVVMPVLTDAPVDVHAAAVSVAQLTQTGGMSANLSHWGLVAVMASSAMAKTALAVVSGGLVVWMMVLFSG
jgi:uncharacterized membrane protein (DUF4010 family)